MTSRTVTRIIENQPSITCRRRVISCHGIYECIMHVTINNYYTTDSQIQTINEKFRFQIKIFLSQISISLKFEIHKRQPRNCFVYVMY